MQPHELHSALKSLRLSGVLETLEVRNRQAIDGQLVYTEFLALLLQDEIARRDQKKFDTLLRQARFRNHKTLEDFAFDRLPTLNRSLVHDLATGRYLQEKAPVLIVGPCGTGKSHLAQALGHNAVRQGVDVRFLTQSELVGGLHAARVTGVMQRGASRKRCGRRQDHRGDPDRFHDAPPARTTNVLRPMPAAG